MMDDMSDFETALSFLQKTPSKGGASVLEHLTDVVTKILDDQPKDAVDLLETSFYVKRLSDSVQESQTPDILAEQDALYAKRAETKLELLSVTEPAIDPETGAPFEITPPNEYECNDILGDGALLEALGVGLPREEMYEVALMSKLLGEDPSQSVSTIRFFGKFYGLERNYYVFETTLKEEPETTIEANSKGKTLCIAQVPCCVLEDVIPVEVGVGANAHVYFVCQEAGGGFTRLPDTTPAQIKASRELRRFLTGSLQSDAWSLVYPPFPGTEAYYLRAIIARIAATTTLCVTGMFTINEDGVLEKQEEFSVPSQDDLNSLSSWCHMYPHLKKQGRCTLHVREAPEDQEADFQATEEETEEGPDLLTSIESDNVLDWARPWTVLSSSSNPDLKHQVIGVRSNLWTGAVSAIKGNQFVNVYIGWGIKDGPFHPKAPPPLLNTEFNEELKESDALPPKPEMAQEERTEQDDE
eukprot:g7244.t1